MLVVLILARRWRALGTVLCILAVSAAATTGLRHLADAPGRGIPLALGSGPTATGSIAPAVR